MKNTIMHVLVLMAVLLTSHSWALEMLSDEDLSQVEGQSSLFTTDYIAPGASNPNGQIGFYRMGLQAELSINANIRNLKLGCDTSDICDINLNNVRLTGLAASSASDSGPGTDAVMTNPFFDIAIKNPDSASTREIVGIRFGAETTIGRMTIGENPDTSNKTDDAGIISFSGDMNAQIVGARMSNICATTFGSCPASQVATDCGGLLDCMASTAELDDYDYAALHGGVPLIFKRSQVTGCGSTDFAGNVNCMFFDGLVARASLFGLVLDSRLTEGLQYIHDLGIEDGSGNPVKDFSMSLQKEAIRWQKVSTGTFTGVVPAQAGWWMSVPNVVVRNLNITQMITVDGLAALGGGSVVLDNVDLGQLPADNCYGSLSFC